MGRPDKWSPFVERGLDKMVWIAGGLKRISFMASFSIPFVAEWL